MPNLINTDSAGNVFYNYITPVVKGETIAVNTSGFLDTFFATKLGTKGTTWFSSDNSYSLRFPAPGLETNSGNITASSVSSGANPARCLFTTNGWTAITSTAVNSIFSYIGDNTNNGWTGNGTVNNITYAVINDYSLVYASFIDNSYAQLAKFMYLGWLRENQYSGAVAIQGLCHIQRVPLASVSVNVRPSAVGSTTGVSFSTAANTITSPPIVCTTGTDPGDGSETFTDIVIRDAASPNNPVGKLWNCIDMPATCNVGELWRNTGAYDGDASASEQDVYLCVMPWGTRKLGMRVWTENIT